MLPASLALILATLFAASTSSALVDRIKVREFVGSVNETAVAVEQASWLAAALATNISQVDPDDTLADFATYGSVYAQYNSNSTWMCVFPGNESGPPR